MIDLHRHDLRREAGASLMEHGMPGRYVQEFLDHANLSTTSRYLRGTQSGLHAAFKAVEERRARTNCKNLQDPEPASDDTVASAKPETLTKQ
jgi:integrase